MSGLYSLVPCSLRRDECCNATAHDSKTAPDAVAAVLCGDGTELVEHSACRDCLVTAEREGAWWDGTRVLETWRLT